MSNLRQNDQLMGMNQILTITIFSPVMQAESLIFYEKHANFHFFPGDSQAWYLSQMPSRHGFHFFRIF